MLDLPSSSSCRSSASPVESESTRPDSAELVREYARTGRPELFEQIVKLHAAMVYATAMRVVKDPHDAEDVTQATFLTLAAKGRVGGEILCPEAWLRRVAHRLALDFIRGNKRRARRQVVRSEMDGLKHHPDSSQHAQNNETGRILREELDRLPPSYRVPLMLHYFGGLDRDAIAGQLKLNPSTLGVRLHRAREQLRKRISDRGVMLPTVAMGALITKLLHDSIVSVSAGSKSAIGAISLASGVRTWVAASVPTTIKLAVAGVALVASVGASVAAVLTDVPGLIQRQIEKLLPTLPVRELMTPIRPLVSDVEAPVDAIPIPTEQPVYRNATVPLVASVPATGSVGGVVPMPQPVAVADPARWPAAQKEPTTPIQSPRLAFGLPGSASSPPTVSTSASAARVAHPPIASTRRATPPHAAVRESAHAGGTNLAALSLMDPLETTITVALDEAVSELEDAIDYNPTDDSHDLHASIPAITPRSLSVSERLPPPAEGSVVLPVREPAVDAFVASRPLIVSPVPADDFAGAIRPVQISTVQLSTEAAIVVSDDGGTADPLPTNGSNPPIDSAVVSDDSASRFSFGHHEVVEFAGIDAVRGRLSAVPTEIDWTFTSPSLFSLRGPRSVLVAQPGPNAVRLELLGKRTEEPAAIRMVLAPDVTRVGLPALPSEHTFIGVWMVEDPGDYETATITVRYDEALAARLGRNESVLKLWVSDGAEWTLLMNDPSFGIDIDRNLIWAKTTNARFFAVSAPEPTVLVTLVSASLLMLRRRR